MTELSRPLEGVRAGDCKGKENEKGEGKGMCLAGKEPEILADATRLSLVISGAMLSQQRPGYQHHKAGCILLHRRQQEAECSRLIHAYLRVDSTLMLSSIRALELHKSHQPPRRH